MLQYNGGDGKTPVIIPGHRYHTPLPLKFSRFATQLSVPSYVQRFGEQCSGNAIMPLHPDLLDNYSILSNLETLVRKQRAIQPESEKIGSQGAMYTLPDPLQQTTRPWQSDLTPHSVSPRFAEEG